MLLFYPIKINIFREYYSKIVRAKSYEELQSIIESMKI